MNGHKLQSVDNFTYLSRVVQIDDEVASRTAKASVVLVDFVQMSGSEMESDTNLKVYPSHDKILNHFHFSCLR